MLLTKSKDYGDPHLQCGAFGLEHEAESSLERDVGANSGGVPDYSLASR
jgi:hypothetical protein